MSENGTRKMQPINLTSQQKSDIVIKIKSYFNAKLDQEIGQFDAEFLLDFFSEEIGIYFYNQGIRDAGELIEAKMDDLQFDLNDLERIEL